MWPLRFARFFLYSRERVTGERRNCGRYEVMKNVGLFIFNSVSSIRYFRLYKRINVGLIPFLFYLHRIGIPFQSFPGMEFIYQHEI